MPVRALTPELAAKARDELNEDPNRIESDLQHIREWIAKQPHLNARTDDQWLLAFLRGSKFSLERTKEKLDLFYTIRTTFPELYRLTTKDPLFYEIMNLGVLTVLPKTATPDGPRITLIRMGKFDPDVYKIVDVMTVLNIFQKICFMEDDNSVVGGFCAILDLENVSMGHFLQMTPALIKKMTIITQDAAPVRMKGVHFLNTPPGFETIFNLMNSFMNEKNKSRLFVHNKNEEMYQHIPKDILPTEYGGTNGSYTGMQTYWLKKVKDYLPWLEEDLKYGTDESKRPGKPKTAGETFGVEGAFRQLDFD